MFLCKSSYNNTIIISLLQYKYKLNIIIIVLLQYKYKLNNNTIIYDNININ
jgi:hypothetical protein